MCLSDKFSTLGGFPAFPNIVAAKTMLEAVAEAWGRSISVFQQSSMFDFNEQLSAWKQFTLVEMWLLFCLWGTEIYYFSPIASTALW